MNVSSSQAVIAQGSKIAFLCAFSQLACHRAKAARWMRGSTDDLALDLRAQSAVAARTRLIMICEPITCTPVLRYVQRFENRMVKELSWDGVAAERQRSSASCCLKPEAHRNRI
jgi:hypothetical protein